MFFMIGLIFGRFYGQIVGRVDFCGFSCLFRKDCLSLRPDWIIFAITGLGGLGGGGYVRRGSCSFGCPGGGRCAESKKGGKGNLVNN